MALSMELCCRQLFPRATSHSCVISQQIAHILIHDQHKCLNYTIVHPIKHLIDPNRKPITNKLPQQNNRKTVQSKIQFPIIRKSNMLKSSPNKTPQNSPIKCHRQMKIKDFFQ